MTDSCEHKRFRWSGSDDAHLDVPCVQECGSIVVGCYGGNTEAGAAKFDNAHNFEAYHVNRRGTPVSESISAMTRIFQKMPPLLRIEVPRTRLNVMCHDHRFLRSVSIFVWHFPYVRAGSSA